MTGFTGIFGTLDEDEPAQRQAVPHRGPWVMTMDWHDLLFAHWPVEPARVAAVLPDSLEPEVYDGAAWVALVPFRMTRNRLRGTPPTPGTGSFAELNLRTYARPRGGGPGGVYFITLDASSALAVAAGRLWWGLNYLKASIDLRPARGDRTAFVSVRQSNGARFSAEYGPADPPAPTTPGTLEHWLTDRYRLYSVRGGRLITGVISHAPWRMSRADVSIEAQTVGRAVGLPLEGEPVSALYARHMRTRFWPPRRVERRTQR